MFLAKDKYNKTAWSAAAERRQLEASHKFWAWAKEVLTSEDLKTNCSQQKLDLIDRLFCGNIAGRTRGVIQWVLTVEELNKELFLVQSFLA
jgi:hypothetical protein